MCGIIIYTPTTAKNYGCMNFKINVKVNKIQLKTHQTRHTQEPNSQ